MIRCARPLSALTATLLILTACTSAGEGDPAPVPAPEEAPVAVSPVELAGEGMVQDTWIYERVRAMISGDIVDVTDAFTAAVSERASAATPVELVDGVEFFPVEGVGAAITSELGARRDDLDVEFGLARSGDAEALQVIATPTGPLSVWVDDLLTFDVVELGLDAIGLVPGTALIVDYAFGQGIPEPGEQPNLGPERTGAHILAERMGSDRFQWFGVEDAGGAVPGMITVVGTVPGEPVAAGQVADASGTETATITNAGYVIEDGPILLQVDNSGGQGGIPLKAQPVTDAVGDVGTCKSWGLKCVSDYFDGMNTAFEKSLDKLFKKNIKPDPPPPPPNIPLPCSNCGTTDGEPHVRTFDQHSYDLQLVGEFVSARSASTAAGNFEVQLRTAPWLSSDRTSVVTVAAVGVGENRVTFDPSREVPIWIDGQPAPEAEHGATIDVGQAVLTVDGRDAIVEYAGARVFVHGLYSAYLGVQVEPGTATDWAGLLGTPNGNRGDDLISREGVVLDPSSPLERIYEEFAHTWRITDDESLFDYGPGESTATFTDLTFPRTVVTFEDLPAGKVAAATTLCREAGVTEQPYLLWCIYDFVVTGEISFVRSAALAQARATAIAGEWMVHLAGWKTAGNRALGADGSVLVPMRQGADTTIFALHGDTGAIVWQVPTGGPECVSVTDNGSVAILVNAGDLGPEVQFLDESDGDVLARADTGIAGFGKCDDVVTTGNTVIFRSGTTLHGADAASGTFLFSRGLDGLTGNLVVSGDGSVWAAVNADGAHIARIDPSTGVAELTAVDVAKLGGNAAATTDGLVVSYTDGDDAGMLRFAEGLTWKSVLTPPEADAGFAGAVTGMLTVTDDFAAGYVGSSSVGVIDLDTGQALRVIDPSSFNNNGGQVFASDRQVIVGPFGGKAWAEAYDLATGELAWATHLPKDNPRFEALGVNDAKQFGPQTLDGGVVASASAKEGTLLYKVGPGR